MPSWDVERVRAASKNQYVRPFTIRVHVYERACARTCLGRPALAEGPAVHKLLVFVVGVIAREFTNCFTARLSTNGVGLVADVLNAITCERIGDNIMLLNTSNTPE